MDETRFERGMSHGEGAAEDKLAGFCQTQSAQVFGGRGVEVAEEIFLQGAQTESATRGEIADGERIVAVKGGPFAQVGHFAASDHGVGGAPLGPHLAEQCGEGAGHGVLEIAEEQGTQTRSEILRVGSGAERHFAKMRSADTFQRSRAHGGTGAGAERVRHLLFIQSDEENGRVGSLHADA